MKNKQREYVIEVLEREVYGYSEEHTPERITLIKEYIKTLKNRT